MIDKRLCLKMTFCEFWHFKYENWEQMTSQKLHRDGLRCGVMQKVTQNVLKFLKEQDNKEA